MARRPINTESWNGRRRMAGDLVLHGGVSAAHQGFRRVLRLDPENILARRSLGLLRSHDTVKGSNNDEFSRRPRIAILSLLFIWPSNGSGMVHSNELAFRDDVRQICGVHEAWGVGRVTEPLSVPVTPLPLSDYEWTAKSIRDRFLAAVDEFVPDAVILTDTTPQVAEELGARVFHWPWCDGFAAARNVSLDHALGEWLFWMDSDDTLPEPCGRQLRALADGDHPPGILGYVMQVHCPGNDATDMTIVDHVKLFRNLPELRFEFRIHEQILPAIRRADGEVLFTDVYVVHSGSDRTKEGLAKKLERDFRLLDLEHQERPDHPFVLFNLGMTHADCGQHADAIRCLQRCLEVSGADESHVRKAYALLISSLMQSSRLEEAELACREGRDAFPDDKELLFRQAMLEHHLGRSQDAVATYRRVLTGTAGRHFSSIDAGLDGFKARHNLALVFEELEDFEAAAAEWLQITQEQPNYLPAQRGLLEAWFQSRTIVALEEQCTVLGQSSDRAMKNLRPYCEGRIAELRGDIDGALIALAEARRLEPRDLAALRQICRILFESQRWREAATALKELSGYAADDASLFCNLGVAYNEAGDNELAIQAFQRSLILRPESVGTWEHLAAVLLECGRESEAIVCLERASRYRPALSGEIHQHVSTVKTTF